jgi:hypothetical protein
VRAAPVPHFGAGRNDRDSSVLGDRQEDVRVGLDPVGHLFGAGRIGQSRPHSRNLRRNDEPAGRDHALEHAATADIGDGQSGSLVIGFGQHS